VPGHLDRSHGEQVCLGVLGQRLSLHSEMSYEVTIMQCFDERNEI
jgi:hypothetical protein